MNYSNSVQTRVKCGNILCQEELSADEKLLLVFQEHKNLLMTNPEMHYAFLAWKDAHRKELKNVL